MKNLGNTTVDLDCNVNIKVIDKHHKVIRDTSVHNKATVNMVDSILRFMKGDFTNVLYSQSRAPEDATPYLPSKVGFGFVGVKSKENLLVPGGKEFDFINRGEFVQTVFTTNSLQEPCLMKFTEVGSGSPIYMKFNKLRQTGYSDTNNSECLEFSVYISPGTLVGKTITELDSNNEEVTSFKPYYYSYWNPTIHEYEAIITEISMCSDVGVLLARVLFDGKVDQGVITDDQNNPFTYPIPENPIGEFTPIFQSETSTVVITWRIGIVSIGKNDKFITESDVDKINPNLAAQEGDVIYGKEFVNSYDGDIKVGSLRICDSLSITGTPYVSNDKLCVNVMSTKDGSTILLKTPLTDVNPLYILRGHSILGINGEADSYQDAELEALQALSSMDEVIGV